MRCFITFVAVASALTLIFSPTVAHLLFSNPKDLPETPADWVAKMRVWHNGQLIHHERIPA